MIRQKGFTLLETMLALFIFSMLSMLAYQILSGALKTNERTQVTLQRMNALQRTMGMLERDILQSLPRVPRGAEKIWHQDENGFAFTTQSRPNAWGLCCSPEILRVSWQLQSGTLHRLVQRAVDVPADSEPLDAPLLDNVEKMSLRFYQQGWKTTPDSQQPLPSGIEITLVLKDFGAINRMFVLPAAWPAYQETTSEDKPEGEQKEPVDADQPVPPPDEESSAHAGSSE
jgi:general secretion pathway protein J